MSCSGMLRLVWTGVPSRWHCPQRKGTFIAATQERGALTGTVSGIGSQVTQRGARESPRATARPCNDFAYSWDSSLWQEPQFTLASGVEGGRVFPSKSAGQLAHCAQRCLELVNFFWSTNSETVLPPRLVVSDLSL